MPVTFPAHQGLVVAAKIRWPASIDGTALCVGAAAPDLAYPLGGWLNHQSHTVVGLLVWAIPITVLASLVVRWRAASGIFAAVPDLAGLKLRSYRVLGQRRPGTLSTLCSAALGAASHVVVDGFTHQGRWGANLANLNGSLLSLPFRGEFTYARLLQYFGHVFGSLVFVFALLIVGARGYLNDWYGADAVTQARTSHLNARPKLAFWILTLGPPIAAAAIARATSQSMLFLPITTLVASLLVAGVFTSFFVSQKAATRSGATGGRDKI